MRQERARRGVVLVIILGTLMLLALLGTALTTLSSVERRITRNFMDSVRATLIAQSGVEFGVERMDEIMPGECFTNTSWVYYGKDLTGDAVHEPDEKALRAAPLEEAPYPSFAVMNGPGPKQIVVDGKTIGFSGVLSTGTYSQGGDIYSLRIKDTASMIYVNDGLATGPAGSVTTNLRRILNVYGKIKGYDGLGTLIVGNRPPGGYKSKYEIFKALNFDKAMFDKVKDDLTTEAWVDDRVCNPVPLSHEAQTLPNLYPVTYYWKTRFGRGKDHMGNAIGMPMLPTPTVDVWDARNRVYAMDELNPNWIEIVSRAPINVNTASRDVLLALIIDLKGFFLTDRRRNNPRWGGDLYNGFKVIHTFSPADSPNSRNGAPGNEGDEVGFLYETLPFVGPWQTASPSQGISAEKVVDEIIACRRKTGSYATKGFGGPFKTWTQFNAFCDNLVKIGIIQDDRNIYFDYPTDSWVIDSSGAPLDGVTMIPSVMQRRHAAQAAADVLKANFNPNLHLNELNPDHNLTLLVDKTDLIVHSTEFVFVPPGLFELQSIGRVLQAKSASTTTTVDYETIAEARVHAVVRLYDQSRQTHQKDFYGNATDGYSELAKRTALYPTTNNNRSIEIGPEPDQGAAPIENEWSGYIALPTVGGLWKNPSDSKQKYNKKLQIMTTPEGDDELDEVFHSHFALDFRAHHHTWQDSIDWARDEICRRDTNLEHFVNHPSKYEDDCPANQRRPPYDPTHGKPDKHRLCRSFRYAYGTSPALYHYAPSNLRIDGGYSERHSSISYLCMKSQNIPSDSFISFANGRPRMTMAMWVKPKFYPELTGKLRELWSWSKFHSPCGQAVWRTPTYLAFYPVHSFVSPYTGLPGGHFSAPKYWGNNIGYFREASLVYGSKAWHDTAAYFSFGTISDVGNHIGHPDEDIRYSFLRAHRWVHIAAWFKLDGSWHQHWNPKSGPHSCMFINGTAEYNIGTNTTMTGGWWEGGQSYNWNHDNGNETNHMRIGNPSRIANGVDIFGGQYTGNYTADITVDEWYVWNSAEESTINKALKLWKTGRYYKPLFANEGIFTSSRVKFKCVRRYIPPPGVVPAPPGPSETVTVAGPVNNDTKHRVRGVSWTWYGEEVLDEGTQLKRILFNYNTSLGAPPVVPTNVVTPRVLVRFVLNGSPVSATWLDNDAVSKADVIYDPDTDKLQYQVRIQLQGADLSTILLSTPVFDDITIYISCGRPAYLEYLKVEL